LTGERGTLEFVFGDPLGWDAVSVSAEELVDVLYGGRLELNGMRGRLVVEAVGNLVAFTLHGTGGERALALPAEDFRAVLAGFVGRDPGLGYLA
jgi:hypothetical protein